MTKSGPVDALSSAARRIAASALTAAALVIALAPWRPAQAAAFTPTFLVATPNLSDPLFQQTVILMLPPSKTPLVVGVIINKPTTIPERKVFSDSPVFKDKTETACFGGPVDYDQPSLLMREPQRSDKATKVFSDIYFAIDPDAITDILRAPQPAKDLRVLLGRAQWSEDQLQAEILEGSWYVMPAREELVFTSEPKRLWRDLVSHAQIEETAAPGPILAAFALPPFSRAALQFSQ